MKFYNSVGPNPRAVRMFMAEKGMKVPLVEVDLLKGENRQAPYMQKNVAGQMPCLELDDGTVISESTAICEYLEDVQPTPALIGSSPKEKAETRMWTRRIDLNICETMANGFRYSQGLPLFKDRIPTAPEAADGLKRVAQDRMAWLDGMVAGRQFVCGDRFTYADIHLFAFLDFGKQVGQTINPDARTLHAMYERMKARPSAGV
ncbi:MAG: glutathione S-transferase family protein [Alphaproteobacteria bacterium]